LNKKGIKKEAQVSKREDNSEREKGRWGGGTISIIHGGKGGRK